MTPVIATHFRIATDAVRQCAYLRRQTAGLRAAAATASTAKTAGARFPVSVLGGELLGLMSEQFRDLVAQSNGRRGTPYSRDARREFGARPATEPDGRPWSGTVRKKSPTAVFEAGTGGSGRAPLESNEAPIDSVRGATEGDRAPDHSRPSPAWGSLASIEGVEFSWRGSPQPASKSQPAERPGAMVKQLREYWELEQRTAASRSLAGLGATETRASEQRVAETESRSSNILCFGQTTFAQRLQAFVSGGGEPREHTPRAPWREAAESAPDAPGLRTISEPTAGTPLSGDFAMRLADTLRSQAIQHGIDLT